MKEYLLTGAIFILLWSILFLFILIYGNSFNILKEVVRFDFKNVNRFELWISLFASFIISAVLSYTMM